MAEHGRRTWSTVWWLRLTVWSLLLGVTGQTAIAWGLCWFQASSGDIHRGAWQWGETKFGWDGTEWFGKRALAWAPFEIPDEPELDAAWRLAWINSFPPRWSFGSDPDETRSSAREYREHAAQNGEVGRRMEFAAGWPRLSLRGLLRADLAPTPAGAEPRWRLHGVLAAKSETRTVKGVSRALPLLPIWSGLTVNVLALGGAVFTAVTLWNAAKRRVRFGRGRCPTCGFDLSFDLSRGCSECGWRKPPREVEHGRST